MRISWLWGGSGEEEVVVEGSNEVADVREEAGGSGARQAVRERDAVLPGGGGAGAASGSACDFGGVGDGEGWEMVEGWEAGASSLGEAVRGEVLPGGGGLGAVTGSGGDEVMRRGVGEKKVSRSEEMDVVEVFPGGGGAGLDTSGSGDDVPRTRRGGGEEEEEEWEEVEFSREVAAMGLGGVDGCGDEETRRGRVERTVHGGGEGLGGGDGFGEVEIRDRAERTGHVGGEGHDGGEVMGRSGGGLFDFTKRTLIAGGARVLLYPALARNVALNTFQPDFHWWDRVDEHVVLGAVPFRSHVPQLKDLGVRAVVTLTEPFETFVPRSYYQKHGIENLAIPTPDYYAAPSTENIFSAVNFMHMHATRGDDIYVHCKAGRGRSTTVVLCYLIKYKNLSPLDAWNHTRAIRPRVSLTSAQKKAVTQFSNLLHNSNPDGYKNDGPDKDASSEEVLP